QYYHEIQGLEGELSGDRHGEAVFATLHRVGRPVLLAALTTAAGFGSLATSSIVPIRHFGIINAVGVLAAVLITLVFVPALLLLRRRTPRAARGMGAPYARGNSARAVLPRLLSAGRWGVLIAGAVVFVVAALGMTRIVVDNSILEYFDRDSEIRRADRFVSKQFAGGKVFSVIVGGAGAGSLTDPEALQAMDDLSSHLTGRHSQVGKVLSFSDFIKRMNKVMHYPELAGEPAAGDARGRHPGESEKAGGGPEIFWTEDEGAEPESFLSGQDNLAPTPEDAGNGPRPPARPPSPAGQLSAGDLLGALNRALAGSGSMNPDPGELVRRLNRIYNFRGEAYNEIPADPSRYPVEDAAGLRNLISQYLLIYSGNLDRFADDALEPSRARMIVQVRSTGTWEVRSIMDDAVRYARSRLPEGYEVDIAGYADMEAAVTGMIVRSQLLSVGAALVAVFLIVAVSFRSLSAGLFSIVPLSFAIVINFGLMGLAGITLDIATAMIASIAIGIGVDYAIHFLHRYRHERSRSRSPDEAAARTMSTTGKAIGFNALAVGAGFAVLLLSNFNPLRYVGLLTAVTMAVSGLAALTLLPVLLNLILPRFAGEPTAHGTHTSGRAPEGGGLEVPS
ncbi:MAG: efflux RND transporter permease subunit, partial [Spirochaetota bacterium]